MTLVLFYLNIPEKLRKKCKGYIIHENIYLLFQDKLKAQQEASENEVIQLYKKMAAENIDRINEIEELRARLDEENLALKEKMEKEKKDLKDRLEKENAELKAQLEKAQEGLKGKKELHKIWIFVFLAF